MTLLGQCNTCGGPGVKMLNGDPYCPFCERWIEKG